MNCIKGTNIATRYIEKYLTKSKKEKIKRYIEKSYTKKYVSFTTIQQVKLNLGNIIDSYVSSLTNEELNTLRFYTGYDFKNINNTMRRNWTYEENGLLTKEKQTRYEILGQNISNIISKFPLLDIDIKTYRGVNLKAFKEYNIKQINELIYLKGKFIFESGFTSTSLSRENSFFNKEPEWGGYCDIEIEYLIPKECQDGAILLNEAISYSTSQMEYVINSGSLSLITDAFVDENIQKAKLKAVLIPKKIWCISKNEQFVKAK